MRANKWRGSENARHGYSTHVGPRCSIRLASVRGAFGRGFARERHCGRAIWTNVEPRHLRRLRSISDLNSRQHRRRPDSCPGRFACPGNWGSELECWCGSPGRWCSRQPQEGPRKERRSGIVVSWEPPVVVGAGSTASASKRINHAAAGPGSVEEGDMAPAALHGLAIVPPIAQMGWQRGGAGVKEKTNKTETNFGKGACQATGSGLRILQAGRFVIEAAFLIPADWRGLAWALMPISKKLKSAPAPAATAETRVTTAATASRRFAIFRIRTWASRPRRPHAAVARSLHVLVRKP